MTEWDATVFPVQTSASHPGMPVWGPVRTTTTSALVLGLAMMFTACSDSSQGAAESTGQPSTETPSTSAVSTTTSTSSTTSTSTTTTTALPPTTTSTTIPIVTEGAVVLVANATNVPGAAGRLTAELQSVGFQLMKATDAAGNEEFLDVSKIYVRPGGEAVAESIARLLGGITIAPMPTPIWITGANAALGDATVVVMLGKDLAGQTPPGLVTG